ncbi:hypothetical protein D3C79_712370 [compost metagenome]
MTAGTVTGQCQPARIPLPLAQPRHDGEGRRQGIVVGRRIDMLRGEAGVHRKHQRIGAIAQHAQLAVVGLELPAHEAAPMKVDKDGVRGCRLHRTIEANGILGFTPLLYLPDLLPLPAQHGRGEIAFASGLPTQFTGPGAAGGDKAIDYLGDGGFERGLHRVLHNDCI